MARSIEAGATSVAQSASHNAWLGALDPYAAYATVVAMVMLIIAVAQWLASYATDRKALRLFSVRYALASLGWFYVHPASLHDQVPFPSVVVAMVLLALTVVALDEYIGQSSRRRLLLTGVATVLATLCVWLYLQVSPGSSLVVYVVMAAAMSWCAWLSWQASRTERQVGHLYIALAFATYPITLLASLATQQNQGLEFGYLAALPAVVVGITILVVSLMRSQRRTEAELEQRNQAQAALRDLNTHLEQRVASRTGELQLMLEGLEAFTRNVSHDLRGPLAGVSGLARLSLEALDQGDAPRAARLIGAVASESERLQTMVQELLTLSRVGQAEMHLHRQSVRSIVDTAVQQLELTPEGAQHLQQVDLQIEELPNSLADPELLSQVFVNLIGNAARFAAWHHPAPGRGTVRVGTGVQGDATAIYVADDGPGFEPSQVGDLFKPFRRLHNQQLSQNGIGLSIVKRIVERHGGQVWAEATPGEGATFWFTLSNVPPPQAAPVT